MKSLSAENIRRRVERAPMLKVLVPLIVGIALADGCTLPLWGVAIGFVVCTVAAIALQRSATADIYIVAALILVGACSMELRRTLSTLPDTTTVMEITIDNITSQRPRATMADARIVAYASEQGYRRSRAEVRVVAEPQLAIKVGDRLLAKTRVTPFEDDYYGRYMLSRGVKGQLYVNSHNIISHDSHSTLPQRLRERAVERLRRLGLSADSEALALAMSVAERSAITPTLRQAYTSGGAAHLLAVSGLHVGFICVMANILLAWMLLLRHGQAIRSVVVVGIIWLFAAMAGFTPSIVRAAVMFSILQVATQLATRTDTLNTLCFTAFIMLVWDARALHDAGFLLSFIAVAAIIEWGVPLFPQRRRSVVAWCWQWLASGVVTSIVAAVATLPLTAYLFGTVSMWSVVTGTIMIALAGIAVGGAMVWILLPINTLQDIARWIIGSTTEAMNAIAAWCNDAGALAAEVRIDGLTCVLIYALMVAVTIIVWAARRKI